MGDKCEFERSKNDLKVKLLKLQVGFTEVSSKYPIWKIGLSKWVEFEGFVQIRMMEPNYLILRA